MTFVTDRVGRATLRLPCDTDLAVFAAHARGFAIQRFRIPKDAQRLELRLQLEAAAWVSGRTVDTEGRPVEGTRVWVRCEGHQQGNEWYGSFLDGCCHTTEDLSYRVIRSDAEGHFRVAFPQTGLEVHISAWRRGEDGSYGELREKPAPFQLGEAGRHDLELVLVDTPR